MLAVVAVRFSSLAFVGAAALLSLLPSAAAQFERIDGGAAVLQFLDGESYRGLFCLSKKHRATLAAETKVLSTEKGTFSFMHSQGLSVAEAK